MHFVALANVGLFFASRVPPLVPDALLSLDVQVPQDLFTKSHRSYFVWEYGKPPDVVIEVVSNKEGHEADTKRATYERIGVKYYVIFDPERLLHSQLVRAYELHGSGYVEMARASFAGIGLSLQPWEDFYDGTPAIWLRWHTLDAEPIPTGAERAALAERSSARERERADFERERADQERTRAERVSQRLRALGMDPDDMDQEPRWRAN